jgi:hypothetical protein
MATKLCRSVWKVTPETRLLQCRLPDIAQECAAKERATLSSREHQRVTIRSDLVVNVLVDGV